MQIQQKTNVATISDAHWTQRIWKTVFVMWSKSKKLLKLWSTVSKFNLLKNLIQMVYKLSFQILTSFYGISHIFEILTLSWLRPISYRNSPWKRRSSNTTKNSDHHRHFNWQSPHISEHMWKAATVLHAMRCAHQGIFLKTLPLNLTETFECIVFCFQFPKFRLGRCFTLSFYHHGLCTTL